MHVILLTQYKLHKDKKDTTFWNILQLQGANQCLKIIQNVAFEFFNFGIIHQFLFNKNLSVFPQAFQKLAKMGHFWHF